MNTLRSLPARFRELQVRQQLAIVGSATLVIVVLFLMLMLIGRTSTVTVTTGLDPKDAPQISQSLSESGVTNEIVQGGTAIAVPEPELDRARAIVATNAPGGASGQVGFELFDKNSLGATDFQQRVQYQRALEGQVARTVQQIEGVRSAQVQLVLPKDQLFTDEGNPASASILLETTSTLTDTQIEGIARLVQTAVEGIQPKNITITTQSGELLWPTDKVTNPDGAGGDDKQSAEDRFANQMTARINGLLSKTLGENKAQATVAVSLNVNQEETEKLVYGPRDGVKLEEKTMEERLRGEGNAPAAPAGTDTNIPTYGQAGGNGGGTTRYDKSENDIKYGVDKEVTRTKVAPGAVERLQVAILVDRAVPAADVTELERSLPAAVGIDAERGDEMQISRVTFTTADEQEDTSKGLPMEIGSLIRTVLLALAVLVFVFFVWRRMRKSEQNAGVRNIPDAPGIDPEIHQPTTRMPAVPAPPIVAPRRKTPESQQQVEQLVDQDAEQVAQQVRQWMNEG